MSTPVLHVLAGPNGAGKTTFVERVLIPKTRLPFTNADLIATRHWPGQEQENAYQASLLAARERASFLSDGQSFITETVFSHPSKMDLIRQAIDYGYSVSLHAILLPEDVAVERVRYRVEHGGHTVPVDKIRERYRRLWAFIAEVQNATTCTTFYDNSSASIPFRSVATFQSGMPVGATHWPSWTPTALLT